MREVGQAAVVIHVQMREDHPLHVARRDADCAQLRSHFLLGFDAGRDFPADIGVQRFGAFEQVRALSGIDHDNTVGMVDYPRIGGQPVGPGCISEDREPSRQAPPAPFDLGAFDANGTSLDGMYGHGGDLFLRVSQPSGLIYCRVLR